MIHLQVVVSDTAELLADEAYGAGALLCWESCDTIDGVYVPGDTVALVTGVGLYDIWDAAGVPGTTWYQTRISDSGGTTFSAYSSPFQTTHGLYLSVDQFRAYVNSPLTDDALLMLLDAACAAIDDAIGPTGDIREFFRVQGDLLMLSRRAESITTVIEDARRSAVTLDDDDYELSTSGQTLYRLSDGTNPRWYWSGRVDVTYRPFDDTANRVRVAVELVKLDLAHQPGLASQTIGTWSETYATGSQATYAEQRAAILASLSGGAWIV